MSDTVTFALIGITILGIALVGLAAWFYVPAALADHDDHAA
jgi:hypothetical protein